MRCKNCQAFHDDKYAYPSYEPSDYAYCELLDIDEDERTNENKKGEYGCTMSYKMVEKLLKERRQNENK